MSKIVSKALGEAMTIQERKLAVTANNLANARTAGYKAIQVSRMEQKKVEPQSDRGGARPPVTFSYVNFLNGSMVETGAMLDMAVEGPGFFVIETENGLRYTRNGQFMLDQEKRLVTSGGDQVAGEDGTIVINGRHVDVQNDGSIYVDRQLAGKLRIVDFKHRKYLESVGTSFFINTNEDNREVAAQEYSIRQGFYEASNVDIMEEMINLINCHRSFEAYDKVKALAGDAGKKLLELTGK